MKTLFLIRHAKSRWDEGVSDFERGLNERGKKNALQMGQKLHSLGIQPDLIYCSPSKRTRSTLKRLCKSLKCPDRIVFKDELYESAVQDLLDTLRSTPKTINTLFIIAHNPSLNEMADTLVSFSENIVTAGVLHIEFKIDSWENANSEHATLKNYYYPKQMS